MHLTFIQTQVLAEGCNLNTCIRVPPSCTSSYDCDFLATYRYDKSTDAVDIEISTSKKFAAFGQAINYGVSIYILMCISAMHCSKA